MHRQDQFGFELDLYIFAGVDTTQHGDDNVAWQRNEFLLNQRDGERVAHLFDD